MITLSQEEYDAIMESREELALESLKSDVKHAWKGAMHNLKKAPKAVAHTAHDAQKAAMHNIHKAQKAVGGAASDAKHVVGKNAGKAQKFIASLPKKAYNTADDVYGKGKKALNKAARGLADYTEESYYDDAYLDPIREAVIELYIENGIEIDDYELGRIDSFAEEYLDMLFDDED